MSSPGSTSFPVAGNWLNSPTSRPMGSFFGSDVQIETIQRMSRSYNASNFRRDYKSVDGRKTCICSSTGSTFSWPDKCYDKIWVGVHGKESVCMVTLKQDVDMTRVDPFYRRYCNNEQTMCSYAQAIVSEVECLPYDDKLRERSGQSIEKPFGVVSVIPCTVHEGSGHEGSSSAEYDEIKAIDFLRDKMKSNLEFTFDETVQTAISALQHLWVKELKAEEIWVTTAWNVEGSSEHMQLTERKEHLAMINGGDGRPTTEINRRRPFVPGPPSGTPFGEFARVQYGTVNFSCLPDFGSAQGTTTTGPCVSGGVWGHSYSDFGRTDYHGPSNLPCVGGGGGPTTVPCVSDQVRGYSYGDFGRTDYHGPSNLPCVGGGGGPTTVPYVVNRPPSGSSSFVFFAPPEFSVPNVVPPVAGWSVAKQ